MDLSRLAAPIPIGDAITAIPSHTPLRRRLQYSLRALLVLVTAASVPLGLWASREHAYRALVANVALLVHHRRVCVEKAGRGAESLRRIYHVDELGRDDVVVGAFCSTFKKKEVAAVLALPSLKELSLSDPGPQCLPGSLVELGELGITDKDKTLQMGEFVYIAWGGGPPLGVADPSLRDKIVEFRRGKGGEPPLGAIDPLLREIASKLPSLEKLDLVATSVSSQGLHHLTALRSLRRLDLSRTRISDDDLACIPALPALEELILDATGPNRHLMPPAELAKVRATNFGRELTSGHEITDEGLRHLAGASRLRLLSLREAKVTGVALAEISTMSRLSNLSLEATRVDDASLRHLARLPSLSRLNLRETHITDAGLMHLATLPSLERVDLYGVESITTAGVARLQALRPELRISVDGSTITDPRAP